METEEEKQLRAREALVQVVIVLIAFVTALLFSLSSGFLPSVNIYAVEGEQTAAVKTAAPEEKKGKSDEAESSEWADAFSASSISNMVSSFAEASSDMDLAAEVLPEKSIDINTASREELDRLPGIGPVLAERIVQYREENGDFWDIEDLKSVKGIGDKTFERLQDYVIAG